jgi:hypothetical protein
MSIRTSFFIGVFGVPPRCLDLLAETSWVFYYLPAARRS